MRYTASFLLPALLLLLVHAGCSMPGIIQPGPDREKTAQKQHQESMDRPAARQDNLTRTPPIEIKKRKSSDKDWEALSRNQAIRQRLADGDFPAALMSIEEALRGGCSEKSLAKPYLRSINGVITEAEKHFARNRPADAGLFFRTALAHYPQDPKLAARVARDRKSLVSGINRCADILMEKGLLLYREGRLEEAIGLWRRLLLFDPQHQECRNAIRTAATQLNNLEKMTAGDKSDES